jgi:hypothetical protein
MKGGGFAVGLCGMFWLTAQAQPAPDAALLRAQARELATLDGAVPPVLVLELREIVERAATRGGASVGSVSQRRRVEAFESSLLAQTRGFACVTPRRPPAPAAVLAAVSAASTSQRLPLVGEEPAALAARTQRLIEDLPASTWCALRTLDPLR